MHTKTEIMEMIKEDSEKACLLLVDFVDKIFDSSSEEIIDFKDEWRSKSKLVSLLQYNAEIDEDDFFDKYDGWEENYGYKIQT